MNNNEAASYTWQEPGVSLTQTIIPDDADDTQIRAVPVFIGWTSQVTDVQLVRLTAREQHPVAPDWPPVLQDTVQHYFDNGGDQAYVLTGQKPETTGLASPEDITVWWRCFLGVINGRISEEPSLTLAAVPQLVSLTETLAGRVPSAQKDTWIAQTFIELWKALLLTFATRPDVFFVLDAPTDPAVARRCIEALRGEASLGEAGQRAALYGPHLVTDYRRQSNAQSEKEGPAFCIVPPCGAVLGTYVRTDATGGVWKAPANEPLLHVVKPQHRETLTGGWFDVEKVPINVIRSFAGRGTRIWGCRTLMDAAGSPFRYVQVRRAVTWFEANLKQICRFAVFEPNNDITWFQLRGLCRAWLRRIWLEGGLAGEDEASAYSVQIGLNASMTAADIAAGRLVIQVGVALLRPAEFIDVTLVLVADRGDSNPGSEAV